jgi:hypothetical protein
MWIKCPNGVDTLVLDPDHVKRLLNEGGQEIPDPTIVQVVEPEQEPSEVQVASEPEPLQVSEAVEDISSASVVDEPAQAEDVTRKLKRGKSAC